MGLIGGKAGRTRSLLSTAPAAVSGTGAGDRPAAGGEWIAALAQTQAVSDHPLNARLGVESALLGYAEAVREQKIGVKATL